MEYFKKIWTKNYAHKYTNSKGRSLYEFRFTPINESQTWTTAVKDVKAFLEKDYKLEKDITEMFVLFSIDQKRSKDHLHSYESEANTVRTYLEDAGDFDRGEDSAFPSNKTYNRDFIEDEPYINAISLVFNPMINYAGVTFKGNTCLAQALSRFMDPDIKFPDAYIRNILNLPAGELIPLTKKNIQSLENNLKININVTGDFEYESTRKRARVCNLKLVNNHIELLNEVASIYRNKKIYYFENKEKYCVYKRVEDLIHTYSDKNNEILEYKDFINNFKEYARIALDTVQQNYEPKADLKQAYEIMTKLNNDVILPGRFKMCKYESLSNLALDIFFKFFLSGKSSMRNKDGSDLEMTNVSELEETFISRCPGPISYNFVEKKKDLKVTYDFNRLYPYIMSIAKIPDPKRGEDYITIPKDEPEFKTLESILPYEDNVYNKTCIYKCFVDTSSIDPQIVSKLVRLSSSKYKLSSIKYLIAPDVDFLTKLGAKITLVQNGSPNCLYYNKLTSMHTLFGDYINYFIEKREKSEDKYEKKFYKIMANILWGSIVEFNRKKEKTDLEAPDDPTQTPDYDQQIKKVSASTEFERKLTFHNTSQPYIYPLARIKPFLLGHARLRIIKDILNSDSLDKCFRIHVDGVSFSDKINYYEERLGDKIGMYKYD